jgi:hypothetical protein
LNWVQKGEILILHHKREPLGKGGEFILVVVCKSTFLDWVVWFWNYGTIICVIFWAGGLKINLEDI